MLISFYIMVLKYHQKRFSELPLSKVYVFVVCSAYLALIIYLFLYIIHVVLILFVHFDIPEEI